jgi:hypothetical protein
MKAQMEGRRAEQRDGSRNCRRGEGGRKEVGLSQSVSTVLAGYRHQ